MMESFDFSFINGIRQTIESENILKYSITGFKAFAIALLGFKYLGKYFQTMDHEEPRLGGFMEILGSGMIIISADWIIDLIENVFAQIDDTLTTQTVPFNTEVFTNAMMELIALQDGCSGLDCINVFIDSFVANCTIVIFYSIYCILWILDNLVYGFYLIERVFLIQIMRFVFPLAIVFSQIDGTKDFFYRWIKKYVGILILPIPYMAIFYLSNIVMQHTSQIQSINPEDPSNLTKRLLLYIAGLGISFFLKMKLFSGTKRLVDNLFS